MKFTYECSDCGHTFKSDEITYTCPVCSQEENTFLKGNLIVKLDKEELERLANKENLTPQDFFPYPLDNPEVFPVGVTPLVTPEGIAKETGIKNLTFKMDSQLLSGSFKDRASQAIVAQAKHYNVDTIALASTGNAGAAMSALGAAYGLNIVLFVPESAPVNKLMQSILYGATVVPVKGTYDDAFALSMYYTEKFGGINRNTAYNPITIEGKKTVSIEIYQQMGNSVPDIVYVPTGDGCIFAGVYKGFYDLKEAGLIEKVPMLVCAQSEKSNAISQAFRTNTFNPIKATTLADSISVSSPANGRMAVRYIKESNGWSTEVKDEEILKAQTELTQKAGVFVEPAAACAYAAFIKDNEKLKTEYKDKKVCVLLTGTGFKDMKVFDGKVQIPQSIENSKEAVEKRFN